MAEMVETDDNSIRELSVTSGVARRKRRGLIEEGWLPAETVLDLPAPPKPQRTRRVFGLGAMLTLLAVCVVLAGTTAGVTWWAMSAQSARETAEHTLKGISGNTDAMQRQLAETLNQQGAAYLHFTPKGDQHGGQIGLLFNQAKGSNTFLLAAQSLPPLANNHTYQLWLSLPPGATLDADTIPIISSGPFTPDPKGGALISFSGPTNISLFTVAYVTEEGDGGAAVPTGPHVFDAQFAQAVPLRGAGS